MVEKKHNEQTRFIEISDSENINMNCQSLLINEPVDTVFQIVKNSRNGNSDIDSNDPISIWKIASLLFFCT